MDLATVTRKLDEALGALKGLFMPTPAAALAKREGGPVRFPPGNGPKTPKRANLAAANVDQEVFASRSFATKGWTLQNAFVTVDLTEDNTLVAGPPPQAVVPIVFGLELQGALDSGWAQLARQNVTRTTLGQFTFPLAANPDSLASNIRFVIFATTTETPPAGGRLIAIEIDGVLQAGYRF